MPQPECLKSCTLKIISKKTIVCSKDPISAILFGDSKYLAEIETENANVIFVDKFKISKIYEFNKYHFAKITVLIMKEFIIPYYKQKYSNISHDMLKAYVDIINDVATHRCIKYIAKLHDYSTALDVEIKYFKPYSALSNLTDIIGYTNLELEIYDEDIISLLTFKKIVQFGLYIVDDKNMYKKTINDYIYNAFKHDTMTVDNYKYFHI